MGYIMEFTDSEIQIHRVLFDGSDMGIEQKADMLWSFDLPYENTGKYSFEARKTQNSAPVITDTNGTASVDGESVELTFKAGEDDDFVHSYEVVVDDKDSFLFFSDFYNGLENMSDTVTLSLKSDGAKHNYKIYAVDSWGEKSESYITIKEN